MITPDVCKCGHTKFYFIGVQPTMGHPKFLNLFNCYNCRTTISVYPDPNEVPKIKAASDQSLVESTRVKGVNVMTDYVTFISK